MYRVDILRSASDAIEAINAFKSILNDGAPEGVVPIDPGNETIARLSLNTAAEAVLHATRVAIYLDEIGAVGLLETANRLIGEAIDITDDDAAAALLEAVHAAVDAVVDEIDE